MSSKIKAREQRIEDLKARIVEIKGKHAEANTLFLKVRARVNHLKYQLEESEEELNTLLQGQLTLGDFEGTT